MGGQQATILQLPTTAGVKAFRELAGMWRDKVDQHNTGTPAYEHIEASLLSAPHPTTDCCHHRMK
jgi:hypothetical protein